MRIALFILMLASCLCGGAQAAPARFDRSHSQFNALLQQHVEWSRSGTASEVDYAGFLADRVQLKKYLGSLASVGVDEFAAWPSTGRLVSGSLLLAYRDYDWSLNRRRP